MENGLVTRPHPSSIACAILGEGGRGLETKSLNFQLRQADGQTDRQTDSTTHWCVSIPSSIPAANMTVWSEYVSTVE